MFAEIITKVRQKTPLVHCITNYVTVTDCANILLAGGGSPIMSDEIDDVADITRICNSLVINIGTLNKNSVAAMLVAGATANEIGHPVILDPVGVGASGYRNECVKELLSKVKFTIIRGNISEIKALAIGEGKTSGVDANVNDAITAENLDSYVDFAKKLSAETGAIIAISGQYDIVADAEKAFVITNGVEEMTKITGSGCMLTTIIGAYCGVDADHPLEAAVAATCAMGICGEAAKEQMDCEKSGMGSFRTYLIDRMSSLTAADIEAGCKYEIR